jgi:hypothetical protein
MKSGLLGFVCLSLVAMLYGCSSTRILSDVPLVWKPTNTSFDSGTTTATGVFSQQYKIMPFVDARENKKEIAKNIEDNKEKKVTTCDDVADWCMTRFKAIIKQHGFNVVEDKASINIKGEILEFYVIEDNFYRGTVGIKIIVENIDGKVLWQGMMSGTAKRFGHSYRLENYYETLSDAYLNAVSGLLKNQEFINALQNKK